MHKICVQINKGKCTETVKQIILISAVDKIVVTKIKCHVMNKSCWNVQFFSYRQTIPNKVQMSVMKALTSLWHDVSFRVRKQQMRQHLLSMNRVKNQRTQSSRHAIWKRPKWITPPCSHSNSNWKQHTQSENMNIYACQNFTMLF